jgi:dimethylglycine dehydrogenase
VAAGGYGHRVGQSLALAYVSPELVKSAAPVEVDLLGTPTRARIAERAPYDPDNERLLA